MSRALHSKLSELYRELAEVHAKLAEDIGADYYDQHTSPLGTRLHCRLIRSGKITGYRAGRRLLAKRADVATFLERYRVAPTDPALGTQDEDEALLATIGGRAA